MTIEAFERSFPATGAFQVQLEGGEPTTHPQFWDFVRIARAHPRCSHLVVCTNGAILPRRVEKLRAWVERLGAPLTIKLSINHHLMDDDSGLIALAVLLRDTLQELGGERLLVINVRLRRGVEQDDRHVRDAVEAAGLIPHSNVFFLQRYGFASDETEWDRPKPVWDAFSLVNPDGRVFGPDLIARSEGMRVLA
jgi:MoaA/NifB/PqqE/SkfB family radical SAM enzyme